MGIGVKTLSTVESFINWFFSGYAKRHLSDYCVLDTAIDDYILLDKRGNMATILKIEGVKKLVDGRELEKIQEYLAEALEGSFSKAGHQMQCVFVRDDERTISIINKNYKFYDEESKKIGLDFEDVYESQAKKLDEYTSYEDVYIVLWTKIESANESIKDESEEITKKIEEYEIPVALEGQNLFYIYDSVRNNHKAFTESTIKAFKNNHISYSPVNVRKAIHEIKSLVDHRFVGTNWEPILQGDPVTPIENNNIGLRDSDASQYSWPKISDQIFPNEAEQHSSNTYKMVDKYFAPITFTMPPQKMHEFNKLVALINKEIPFQISIRIQSVNHKKFNMKSFSASLLAWSNSETKLIKRGMDDLKEQMQEGKTVVEVSIDALTWAYDEKTLNQRREVIMRMLQSWGNSNIDIARGDLCEAILATMPAITDRPYSPTAYFPIQNAIKILPINRPSNPWNKGPVIFRTEDHKLMFYHPMSGQQNAWNKIFFATPGSGKSVLLNSINRANMALGGFNDVPMGLMIDIGESSSGSIQLIKDSLPPNKSHLLESVKIQNTEEYAINILDTQLGERTINQKTLSTLANFVTLGMTEYGKEAYDSLESMITEVIKESYDFFSEKEYPKEYIQGRDQAIDKILLKHKFNFEEDYNWWEIVDFLFDKKEYVCASSAQKYAVPTLVDLPRVAQQSNNLTEMYGDNSDMKLPTGENMIDFFSRGINEIVTSYPVLAHPTQYDISSTRFLCIDLNDVAPEGDGKAAQQTALMYMMARIIGTKNFFIDDSLLKTTPEQYHSYHRKRIKIVRETPKILSYDEFHRTGGSQNIRKQVIRDMREGRKWYMQVNLVSQFLTDFDKDMVDISDSIFILSGGDISEEITNKFKLNKTMKHILETKINGPTKEGSPMIVKHRTKKGDFQQYVYFTLSELELWSNNSSAKDSNLRKNLSDLIGNQEARKLLAKEFPTGEASAFREYLEEKGDIPKNKSTNEVILEKILEKNKILH